MRIRLGLVVPLFVASALSSGNAWAEPEFRHGGAVVIGTVSVDGTEPERIARCDYLLRGEDSAGTFGEVIRIPPPYGDGMHTFTLVDGLMGATDGLPLGEGVDFDVTFTGDLGACAEPLAAGTRFESPGNEKGVVPEGTRYGIVTMRTVQRPESAFELTIAGRS